ncbi:MAG: cryptochrome/photolyase family protein [Chloroflexota bacterium]
MARKPTVWILGDQLSLSKSALPDEPSGCVVLMIESLQQGRQRPYHKQKLVFLWSAMRHFAVELRQRGYEVDYYEAADSINQALQSHIARYQPDTVRLMGSAEYGRTKRFVKRLVRYNIAVEITPNIMFLSNREAFAEAARGKKQLLMESFYRKMRKQTGLLMIDGKPAGGEWNFDKYNREKPDPNHRFPDIPRYQPDEITQAVITLVNREFPDHFGELSDFPWPVTRAQAHHFLTDFLEHRLDLFGPYEDAILLDEPAMYHSLLSPLINIGLLEPLEVCRAAEARYEAGLARLNSVEGFIRQIIGWREFIYQIYHLKMPGYLDANALGADIPLPDFYWTGDTDMRCVANAVNNLRQYGINHHIQRLMITGNFALIAGIDPQAVNDWYWLAYIDAYEWVVSPNVLGMALYADGGLFATKPYASSANYINKMSNCCKSCQYNHRQTTMAEACPFNALYWDFLARNQTQFKQNPRMTMMLALLNKRDPNDLAATRAKAAEIRDKLRSQARI